MSFQYRLLSPDFRRFIIILDVNFEPFPSKFIEPWPYFLLYFFLRKRFSSNEFSSHQSFIRQGSCLGIFRTYFSMTLPVVAYVNIPPTGLFISIYAHIILNQRINTTFLDILVYITAVKTKTAAELVERDYPAIDQPPGCWLGNTEQAGQFLEIDEFLLCVLIL